MAIYGCPEVQPQSSYRYNREALFLVNPVSTEHTASSDISVVSTTHQLWCLTPFSSPTQCFWPLRLPHPNQIGPLLQRWAKSPNSSKISVLSSNSIIHSFTHSFTHSFNIYWVAFPSQAIFQKLGMQQRTRPSLKNSELPKGQITHVPTHKHTQRLTEKKIIWKNKTSQKIINSYFTLVLVLFFELYFKKGSYNLFSA